MWKNKNKKKEKIHKETADNGKENVENNKKEIIEQTLNKIDAKIEECTSVEQNIELLQLKSLMSSLYEDIKKETDEKEMWKEIMTKEVSNTIYNQGNDDNRGGYFSMCNTSNSRVDECNICKSYLTKMSTEGFMVCENCMIIQEQCYECGNTAKDKNTKSTSTLSYKKISHFNDLMLQLQCKEKGKKRATIREMEIIREDILSRGEKIEDIKPVVIKTILKKHNFNHLYDSIPSIECQLKNKSAIVIPLEVRETLRNIFKELQIAWRIIKPNDRKNFPGYNFVYRKIFQLIGMDDYMEYFPLPENKNGQKRIKKLALIWKQMCEICSFEYIGIH